MAELGWSKFACGVMMSMVMTAIAAVASAEVHYVGGNKMGWARQVNLSNWSSKEHFYIGDWLYFGFDKTLYNVLEVNESSYENCIDAGFIRIIAKGGRDVYQLTEAKTYYFLSGGGYCFNGMKVDVSVEAVIKPSPPPEPEENGGSSLDSAVQLTTSPTALLSAVVWTLFFQ